MPNWCSNELIITGPVADVEKFVADVKAEEDGEELLLSFDKLVPVPEEVKDPNPEYQSRDQCDWSVENWGTKWDLCAEDVRFDTFKFAELNHSQVNYSFQTAWSPCNVWVKKVSLMYPTLEFDLEYGEEGMDFQGRLLICNGEIAEEYHGEFVPSRWGIDDNDEEEESE